MPAADATAPPRLPVLLRDRHLAIRLQRLLADRHVTLLDSPADLPAVLAAGPCPVVVAGEPDSEISTALGELRQLAGHRAVLLVTPEPALDSLAVLRQGGPADWVTPDRLLADGPARLAALQAQVDSQAAQAELAAIAGGLAHDLNSVLGGLMGASAMLRGGAQPDPVTAKLLDRIDQAVNRGAAVIARLSACVAAESDPDADSADAPATLLQEAADSARETLPPGIELELADLPADAPATLPASLRQLAANLVDAAAAQLPRGGRLTLGLRPLDSADDGRWRLAVDGVASADTSPAARMSDANPLRARRAADPAGLSWALAQRLSRSLHGDLDFDRDGDDLHLGLTWAATPTADSPDAKALDAPPNADTDTDGEGDDPGAAYSAAALIEPNALLRGMLHDSLALLHVSQIHDLRPNELLDDRPDLRACPLYLIGLEPDAPSLPAMLAAIRQRGPTRLVLMSETAPSPGLDLDAWLPKPVSLPALQAALNDG